MPISFANITVPFFPEIIYMVRVKRDNPGRLGRQDTKYPGKVKDCQSVVNSSPFKNGTGE